MPMMTESRRRLQAFVDRMAKVESFPYFKGGDKVSGGSYSLVDGKMVMEFFAPPEHDTHAVLLHLRLLIQNDDISIGRLAELYDDPGVSADWKREHGHWRTILNDRLDSVYAEGVKGTLTHRELLEMYLYGDVAHLRKTDRAYKLYEKWIVGGDDDERALDADAFQGVVILIVAIAHNIAVYTRRELARDAEAGAHGAGVKG